MKFFNFKKKSTEIKQNTSDDLILKSFLSKDTICERETMNIPAVSNCVSLIADNVSMIHIKIWRETPAETVCNLKGIWSKIIFFWVLQFTIYS